MNLEQKWLALKTKLHGIIDNIAPIKKIQINKNMDYPWVDFELIKARKQRDCSHKRFTRTHSENDYSQFVEAKKNYNKLIKPGVSLCMYAARL